MSRTTRRHRVLLVGPWRSGTAAGGCCSADVAAVAEQGLDRCGPGDADQIAAADVVRALRAAVTDAVAVELVDPRNSAYLLPTVYLDARRAGLPVRAALRQAVRATTPWTLVVDGVVAGRDGPVSVRSALDSLPADFKYC